MLALLVILIFTLTVTSIFVDRGVIDHRLLRFLDIPYFISPLIGAFLLFLFGALNPEQVFRGLFTSGLSSGILLNNSGPFSTVLLFLSISFVSLSLEVTGFFRYLSVKILEKVDGSGKMLFTAVFWITAVFALFTSNDIIILTLTPFLLEFLSLVDVKAVPFLIAEFFAANIFSMILLIGNETNIIASTIHNIGFMAHLRYMFLPGLAGGLAAFSALYLIFRDSIDCEYSTEELPEVSLNRWEVLTFSILSSTILSLAFLSMNGFLLWHIGLMWAVTTFLIFGISEIILSRKHDYLKQINDKMPWEVVPFLTGFFLIVQAFSATGLISTLSQLLYSILGESTLSTVFGVGALSTISANLLNNIPMTALFSDILSEFASGKQQLAAVFSLIIGSNIGANITPIGALAGIMWIKMVNHGDKKITFREFLNYGLKTTSVTAVVSLIVLYLVLM